MVAHPHFCEKAHMMEQRLRRPEARDTRLGNDGIV